MKGCKKIHSNVLQQDIYVRDASAARDLKTDFLQKSYVAQDFKTEQGAVREVLHREPYPITPDYVNSFVDACDYRSDPLAAQVKSANDNRKNLGDVASLQNVYAMSAEQVSAYLSKLQNLYADKVTAEKAAQSASDTEVNNNG